MTFYIDHKRTPADGAEMAPVSNTPKPIRNEMNMLAARA